MELIEDQGRRGVRQLGDTNSRRRPIFFDLESNLSIERRGSLYERTARLIVGVTNTVITHAVTRVNVAYGHFTTLFADVGKVGTVAGRAGSFIVEGNRKVGRLCRRIGICASRELTDLTVKAYTTSNADAEGC